MVPVWRRFTVAVSFAGVFAEDRAGDLPEVRGDDPEGDRAGDVAADRVGSLVETRDRDFAGAFALDRSRAVTEARAVALAVAFAGDFAGFDGVPGARLLSARTIVLPRTSTSFAFACAAIASGSTSVFWSHLTLIILRFLSWDAISSIIVSVLPCLPIQTVGFRSCIELLFGSAIRSHHAVSRLFVAGAAGDHDIPPVYPHPHIVARDEKRVTVVAVLPTEFPVDPDTLAHCDLPGKFHVTVAPFRVLGECPLCLHEEFAYALLCDLLCCRVPRSLFHNP